MSIDIRVVVAFSTHHEERNLNVPEGTTARAAVVLATEAGLPLVAANLDPVSVPIGVFGEQVKDDYPLAHGDRVEIYRLLQQDPKELRRQRARQESAQKNR